MKTGVGFGLLVVVLGSCGAILLPKFLLAEPVPVRQRQGLLHGFLVLSLIIGTDNHVGQVSKPAKIRQIGDVPHI